MAKPTLVIVSGYFNPLHVGHLAMLRAARDLGDEVVVIVNNDIQQLLKKGRIISPENERLEIAGAIRMWTKLFSPSTKMARFAAPWNPLPLPTRTRGWYSPTAGIATRPPKFQRRQSALSTASR